MARRGSFRRGGGISDSQRRKKTWISLKVDTTSTTPGQATFMTAFVLQTANTGTSIGSIESQAFGAVNEPFTSEGGEVSSLGEEVTILRMRGSLTFPKSDGTPGAVPGVIESQYAFGLGVTDVRSLVGGVFPGPIIDADWDGWMFLRQSTTAPLDPEGTAVDVKAMRKIQSGDAFFASVQAVNGQSGITTPAADWVLDLRLLLLLP